MQKTESVRLIVSRICQFYMEFLQGGCLLNAGLDYSGLNLVKATFHLTISMRGQRATGKIQRNNYHHRSCGSSLTGKTMSVFLIFTQGTHRNVKNRWVRSSLYECFIASIIFVLWHFVFANAENAGYGTKSGTIGIASGYVHTIQFLEPIIIQFQRS